ncbi:UNVERIFIED_CONTAM: hypothetical protein GTU68_053612 [Idotea baltica]|nr:hypothetical protein [Idotea baltica]
MSILKKFRVIVDLQNPYDFDALPDLAELQLWCKKAIQTVSYSNIFNDSLSVLVRVVNDAESAELNKTYREKEGPTNIEKSGLDNDQKIQRREQQSHLGDLVICHSLVANEALEQDKSVISHWAHLIVHGTLHLQGFDHVDDDEADQMEGLEIKILEQLGFKNPYMIKQ